MMNLQTAVHIAPQQPLSLTDRFLLVGSCFSEHICQKMQQVYLNVSGSPYGTLYNPASIERCLTRWLRGEPLREAELVEHDGLWHSWWHHGDYSAADPQQVLQRAQADFDRATRLQPNVWIITLGTAYVYERPDVGVVSNCHKWPAADFTRRRLSVDEAAECLERTVRLLPADCRVLFTVSPIRHLKDGLHDNQLSKSTLLLAVEQVVARNAQCGYFPSYEIVMDELRDYRFYADDMLHPSAVAVEVVWNRFCETYFSPADREKLQQLGGLYKRVHHRPLHTDTEQYRAFAAQTQEQIAAMLVRYPFLPIETNSEETK